ncbi:MAG: hypothetical protein ACRCXM_08805, partial [Beijerinckiaceae bacterium]
RGFVMRLILAAIIVPLAAPPALAQIPAPPAAEQRAQQFERECAKVLSRGERLDAREEDWLDVISRDGNGRTLLLDSRKTRCASHHHAICGTGGCPVVIYRIIGRQVRKLYDGNVLQWRVSDRNGRKQFHAEVHGSHCGKPGNSPCETFVDLVSEKVTTRQPE